MTAGANPIRQFVLKMHSRCNLACDYCYVYEMADQSWRQQPLTMNREVLECAAGRIAEHAHTHQLPAVNVVFHGGEPLLAGADALATATDLLRNRLGNGTDLIATVQTNGILLTDRVLAALARAQISVAVSLDGTAEAHNRHRKFASGTGSYAAVARGLDLLGSDAYRHLFSGLLCKVDLAQDPVGCYESLLQFKPPRMDFLLPLGNWTSRPPGRPTDSTKTPYADWLGAVFDRWYNAPRQETELRLFREIMHLLLGGVTHFEGLGAAVPTVAVIESDGSLEQVDALKSAFPGATSTGLHVMRDSVDDLLDHPAFAARRRGIASLADECKACLVRDVCGGGFYPHRYRSGAGFDNPSVYCPDLFATIQRIRARLVADIGRLGTAVN